MAVTQIKQYSIRFYGPHSQDLMQYVYTQPPAVFNDVFIGSGESKAVAAMRALSHMKGAGYSEIFTTVEKMIMDSLPSKATTIEGDENCSIYCVLAFEAEHDDI